MRFAHPAPALAFGSLRVFGLQTRHRRGYFAPSLSRSSTLHARAKNKKRRPGWDGVGIDGGGEESRTPVHNSSSRGVFRLSRFSGWGLVGKATNGANPCWSKLVPRHASCVRGGNPLR